MTIRKRVITTCAILVALSALIASVALYSISGMSGNIRTLSTDAMPGVHYALETQLLVYQFRGNCWKHIASTDAATMGSIESANQEIQSKLEESLRLYEASIAQPEDRERFAKVKPILDRYYQAWQSVLPLSRASKNAEATALYMSQADPVFRDATQVLQALTEWNLQYGDRASKAGMETAGSANTWTTLLALIAVFAGMGLAFYLVRKLTGVMHGITAGIAAHASQVSSAASQIASSSQVMAQNASQNAAALEETSASTHEMTAQIQENAQTAVQLTQTMAAAVPVAERVNAALSSLTESIGKLNTSSQKIATIVKVIDEIAFQTNILALNAAVEAARSGEAGMGFAVVADEVRNLAHRSAEAAKQTAGLIEESVSMVRESSTRLAELTEVSKLNSENAAHVKGLVDHVTAATQQQAQAIREIEQALPQLEQGTQHVAAAAQEGASAAEEVTAQSASLKDTAAELTAVMGF